MNLTRAKLHVLLGTRMFTTRSFPSSQVIAEFLPITSPSANPRLAHLIHSQKPNCSPSVNVLEDGSRRSKRIAKLHMHAMS